MARGGAHGTLQGLRGGGVGRWSCRGAGRTCPLWAQSQSLSLVLLWEAAPRGLRVRPPSRCAHVPLRQTAVGPAPCLTCCSSVSWANSWWALYSVRKYGPFMLALA